MRVLRLGLAKENVLNLKQVTVTDT
uniref:Uncharacterized protein n=1 Tax=Arundo donax TaxID=35708 RepID=A0A0A9BT48_ARUDO